ncbi:hypothetical protein ACP70R_030950 [Stipagrostis hirtigluma subsp. patula]
MAAAVASLYRRVLPSPPAVDFASPEGKRLFAEALAAGTMEGFFPLVSCFQTQSEPAFCGLASLSVVLNALAIDPGRRWKGPWRWFDESMLDCCEPLDKVKAQGITFGKVACLAHCSGADVRPFRANRATIDDLRRHLMRCASSQDCHLIASYHRRPFKQGSWLYQDTLQILHHCTQWFLQSCRDESWKSMAKYCVDDLPTILKAEGLNNVPTLLSSLIESLPASAEALIKWVVEVRSKQEGGPSLSKEEEERLVLKENVLQQVHDTNLFTVVHGLQSADNPCYSCSSSGEEDSLNRIAASVCRQGAAVLSGNLASRDGLCCRETCSRCAQANGDGLKTVISGSVASEGNEQGVDMLLPTSRSCASSCSSNINNKIVKYPSSADLLTVLLLALHPRTWLGIKDEKLKAELRTLVSTDILPDILKREILHLRRQLYYLNACEEEEYEDTEPLSAV